MQKTFPSFAWPTLALLFAMSCATDDRSLSFQVGALGSASSHGGADDGPPAGAHGDDPAAQAGQSASGGRNGTAGSQNDGGSAPSAGGDGAAGAEPGNDGGNAHTGGSSSGTSGNGGNGNGGNGGNGNGGNGGNGNGGVGGGGVGGGGGNGGNADVEPGNFPCGNLNRNGVDDCAETLVSNSRFEANGAGWEAEGSLLQAWKNDNARGGSGSGSLSLLNGNVVAAADGNTAQASHQCILAWGGDMFELGARVFIKPNQGAGSAGVNLIFFGSDACSADKVIGGQNVGMTSDTSRWVVVRSKLEIPAGTRSARVRLMVAKPFAQPSFEAQFDDVLVVKQ